MWRSKDELIKVLVSPNDSLWDTLPKMEEAALQVLLVVDESEQLVGIITDGDVRRVLLHGQELKVKLSSIMNPNPCALPLNTSITRARDIMKEYTIRHIPLIDDQGRPQDMIIWSDCFGLNPKKHNEKVVIMAGGKGTRLDPFTKILPKPMIPLGDKPIIEVIMDKFYKQGFSHFILCLGYKAEIIKMYFNKSNGRPYQVDFVYEEQPLGTAGALSLLKGQVQETFLVTNCDIILEPHFSEVLKQHTEQNNDLTLIGTVKEIAIPYGVLETEGQNLLLIKEKPNFLFLVNTGVYILDPGVLELIQNDEYIDMTDLSIRVKENNGRVGVYPYHGKWFDVGQWEDYRNTLRHLGYEND